LFAMENEQSKAEDDGASPRKPESPEEKIPDLPQTTTSTLNPPTTTPTPESKSGPDGSDSDSDDEASDEKPSPEEEIKFLRKQVEELLQKLKFLSQEKIEDEEIRRMIVEKDHRVSELERKLEEEGKERAKLLARIEKGGLKAKKPSMAQSIIQWEKDQMEKEKQSSGGSSPASSQEPPSIRKNQTMVVDEKPRGPMRSSTSSSLWAKGMQESRMEIQRKKDISKPMEFIVKLKEQPNLTFLKSLENKIAKSSDEWLLEFMNNEGLTAIIDANRKIDQIQFKKVSDIVTQIQFVMCIRALLNNTVTLEILLNDAALVKTLVSQSISTKNVMMRVKFFELFAALCLYSDLGWKNVCNAFKETGGSLFKTRFSYLVHAMSTENDTQFRRASVSLVNAIIQGKESYEERVSVRQEFIRDGLLNALHLIESENFTDPDEPLSRQLIVFQDSWEEDQKEKVRASLQTCANIPLNLSIFFQEKRVEEMEVDMGNTKALFEKVYTTLGRTEFEQSLLTVLQQILLISQDDDEQKRYEKFRFVSGLGLITNPGGFNFSF
jgi:hypothetical protein